MSTFISDLPGSQEEIMHPEQEQEQFQEQVEQPYQEEYQNTNQAIPEQISPTNIKVAFKKKDAPVSWYDSFKKEFNEENALLLVLLYVATLSQSNEYIRKGLLLSSFGGSGHSHMSITLLKCVLLLLAYLIVKKFFLDV